MKGLQMKYFVLNPLKNDEFGKASREAIKTYAVFIAENNTEFAGELLLWMEELESLPLKD